MVSARGMVVWNIFVICFVSLLALAGNGRMLNTKRNQETKNNEQVYRQFEARNC